jgi:uncharacterized iron-regulated membrane protein
MKHQRTAGSARKPSNPRREVHRCSVAERRRWLDRHERSGLSQWDFCARHGLALSTFTYWKRRERATGAEQAISFVEVPGPVGEAQALPMTDAAVVIELAGGVRIELPQATEAKWLAALLREIGAPGCSR